MAFLVNVDIRDLVKIRQFIGFMILIYSNVTLAEFSSFRGSLSPTSQFYEHFTKNDYSTFAIGCGKSKEYTFLTLKITSQKLKKTKGILDFNISVDGEDSYELKAGFYPNNSTIMVTRPPQKLIQEIKKGHITDIEVYSKNKLVFKSIYSLSGSEDALEKIYKQCALPFNVM